MKYFYAFLIAGIFMVGWLSQRYETAPNPEADKAQEILQECRALQHRTAYTPLSEIPEYARILLTTCNDITPDHRP